MTQWRLSSPVLAFLWIFSFFLSLPLVEPYELSRLGSAGFMLAAVILAGWQWLNDEERQPIGSLLTLLLLLLFGWAALSLVWTDSFYHSYIGIWRLFLLPASFLLFLFAGSPALYRSAAIGAALVLGGLAAWALLEYFILSKLLIRSQVHIPFANPNSFAALLALGFLPGLGLMLVTKNRLLANLLLLFCALTLAAIIILASRGVLIGLAIALGFIALANRKFLRTHWKCGLILIIVALSTFALSALTDQGGAAARLGRFVEDPEAVAHTRLIIWQATWEMIKDYLFLGTGFETFALHYPAYRPLADYFSGGRMAHNDPLQFWAELGLPAFLLFYLIIGVCGFYMIRFLRQIPPAASTRILPVSCFAGLGLILFHSHISFDLYIAAFLPLLGALLAYWHSATRLTPDRPAIPVSPIEKITFFVLLLTACAGFFLLQGLLRSAYHGGEAEKAASTGDTETFAAAVNRAHDTGFGLHPKPYLLAASLPLTALEDRGYSLPTKERAELLSQAENFLSQAQKRNPLDPRTYYAKARLFRLTDEPEKAVEQLIKALEVDPLHLPSRMMLADLYQTSGDNDKAWKVLKAGLERPYRDHNAQAYYLRILSGAFKRDDLKTVERAQHHLRRSKPAKKAEAK